MKHEALKYLEEHELAKAAMKATGRSFSELVSGIKVEPNEALSPESWMMSWPGDLIPPEKLTDVHPLAVLFWFYTDESWDHPAQRELAANYLTKQELALTYSDGVAVKRGRAEGGRNTGKRRKEDADRLRADIVKKWHALSTMPEQNRSSAIAARLGITPKHVRDVLRKANLR
ncbi:hypothetical protein LY622_21215 [Halomonas sp. M5N1S17]|uniref:hypothetical protein n=1 Tax=Halomonas alkalisoli TaxID=2907158 RepID=UPI001F1653F6|nr:hypothetical protein [Halomonas alkalisoli]MCE9665954.1 hypothetical protein [Halomonas alkalisoli]